MRKRLVGWIFLGMLSVGILSACLPSAPPRTAPPPAPTSTPRTLGAPPVASRHAQSIPTQVANVPTAEPSRCTPESGEGTAIRYDIAANLDYTARTIAVQQDMSYRNDTGQALDSLIFYVPVNNQPNVFTLSNIILEDGALPAATLEGVRLIVPLPQALSPLCRQNLRLEYSLQPPQMGAGYFPRRGYFGYSDEQFNLGLWTASVAYFDGEVWHTPPPINIGEQDVLTAADYHVELTVANAPEHLTVVGPGEAQRNGSTWEFGLPAARDLAISMSDQYHRSIATAPNGVHVELYTLDDAQPAADSGHDAPAHALVTATAAVELYADLYGDYPYERLIILESDFPDGMEFSGMVFVGGEWFRSYDGDPACYLTLITAHEVAHQWWYNVVGNDQAEIPWLDEALATYSEYVFLEENYPALTDWWWPFRVDGYSPEGYVDSTVYQFDTLRGYINAVYLRGARLLHELRQEMGGEAFFQWLHDYVAAMQGEVAVPDDLWATLPPDILEATFGIRRDYLREPGSES